MKRKDKQAISVILATVAMTITITQCMPAMAYKKHSTVQIFVDNTDDTSVKGTGFFVERNLIMTAKHVVEESKTNIVKVRLRNHLVKGMIVGLYPYADLALIQIRGSGERPFKICNSSAIGDMVTMRTYDNGMYVEKSGVITKFWAGSFVTNMNVIGGNSGSPVLIGKYLNRCVAGVLWARDKYSTEAYNVGGYDIKNFLFLYHNMVGE